MDSLKDLKSFLKALPRLNDKDKQNRILKAKDDFRYFVLTYLSHHLGENTKETSNFRKWVYKELPNLLAPNKQHAIPNESNAEVLRNNFKGYQVKGEGSVLNIHDQALSEDSLKITRKTTHAHNRILVKAYRGAAKTTLISRLLTLWQILRGDKRYAILISSTLDLAKEGIDLLKIELEDNANLIHDFGIKKGYVWNNEEIVFSIEHELRSNAEVLRDNFKGYRVKGEGSVLNIHDQALSEDSLMQLRSNKSTLAKSIRKTTQLCKIKSFGAGKKIRGTNFLSIRPDLIICDDIENDENIESKTQRDKLYKWFNKAILKLPSRLNPNYNLIIVGTTLHYDSLLQRIAQRSDFTIYNFPLITTMPSNLDSLTKENLNSYKPTKYTLDDTSLNIKEILSDYLEDKASFYSEFQNEPLDKDNAPLSNYTTYTNLPPHIDSCFIGIDPSLGKKRGDYFALSTLFYNKKESKIYASSKGYKIAPDKMIDKILTLFTKTRKLTEHITIACEEVAFQEFFKNELKKKFLTHGIYTPIIGIKSNTNKEIRLDSLAPLLSDGDLLIYENDNLLKEELDTYPKGAHDDLIDSIDIARRAMIASSCINYKEALKATRDYKDKFNSLKEL